MRPLSPDRVRLTDSFWAPRQLQISEATLPQQFEKLEESHRLRNLRIAAGKEEGDFYGFYFNDSDVYKWMEAVAYSLKNHDSKKLRDQLDVAVAVIQEAQEESGYIDSFFQIRHPKLKLKNLNSMHEMYCAGHLVEAGVALAASIGDRRILDVALKFTHYLMSVFGPGKRRGYPGHEEIELALIKLSEFLREPEYREFARWMVDERGKRPTVFEQELEDPDSLSLSPWVTNVLCADGAYKGDYCQDHAPVREHTEVVGHAVRAMYLYTAAADLAGDQQDEALEAALVRAWNNLTQRRMYVTGGIGPSSFNEGFTADFDLPNLTSYAETCAACGLIFWGQAMLEQTGESGYADVIERALYNGALAGIGLDGTSYFYANPLESRGTHQRVPWFECACCPPNIARLIANLSRYVVGEAPTGFFVHQYVGLEASLVVDHIPVQIKIDTKFPWSGEVTLAVEPEKAVEFRLSLRIPEWTEDVSFDLEGSDDEAEYENGYAVFARTWSPGDSIKIDLGMMPGWVEADPRVLDNLGRSALTYGPLVYCMESHDNDFLPQNFTADTEADVTAGFEKDLLGGVRVVEVEGIIEVVQPSEELYPPRGSVQIDETTASFIPYFAWANRGPSQMQVWVRG